MHNIPHYLGRLELDASADERAIKRAYARKLKQIDPEQDPAAFQALREVYEAALAWAQRNSAASKQVQITPEAVAPKTDFSLPRVPLQPAGKPETREAESSVQAAHADSASKPAVTVADPRQIVEAVFREFLQSCAALVRQDRLADDLPWQGILRRSLDDPRLDNLSTREIFEYRVASQLVGGWQPGHEALLVAAGKVFHWSEDRRRLARFAYAGELLNLAIEERNVFNRQSGAAFEAQKKIITRLRNPKPPSNHELIKRMATIEMLANKFPRWIPLVTSAENILTWRRLDKEVPGWQRKIRFSSGSPKPSGAMNSTSGVWKFGALMLVVAVLRGIAGNGTPTPPPSLTEPVHSAASASQNAPGMYPHASGSPQMLARNIRSNIHYDVPLVVEGNPAVEYKIELYPDGTILALHKLKPSGLPGFDEAVMAGLRKTQPFPGDIPRQFVLTSRAKDQ
ncbi:protein TonB [Collimonas sp. PA-H2]|uniref:TonB C-terminal domain-containing protein n=1 Tax=Collimonas sp. PA-H2 TaxID=1881062 RepID=UPI000BF7D7AC|nr:TonB C-terminal domain-containing protein [Collimonas sp. PA-H2]PFH09759.1 protein TonB [Collimonas sp. PA-H2]